MQHAQVLDCTLRDGAYLIDKNFGEATIHGFIDGLSKAKIDFIEIGFLQDEGFAKGKTVFKNGADAQKFIPKEKNGILYTVLADCSRYSVENLDENSGNTFDAIRVCFFKKERYDAIELCKKVAAKGYAFFVQPVDILGYSDKELIELIQLVNEIKPLCFSIVDTFGSMYMDDLERVYYLIDHNLSYECKIGFHSHNNLQMSSALSQYFLKISFGKRKVVVDTTVYGMGRGAGNTPTELVVQYMIDKMGYSYNMDAILDIIDTYMPAIQSRCHWGYDIPFFLAGCYSAHVNNITYLAQKNCIGSKDIRFVLNKIGSLPRKRYDYDLLEKTYTDYLSFEYDDTKNIEALSTAFSGKDILIVAPGSCLNANISKIQEFIKKNSNTIVIAVNFFPENINADYLFFSNMSRYIYWQKHDSFSKHKKILTSNIKYCDQNTITVSYRRLVKCGWENMENATIFLLRLLDTLNVRNIYFAGFDGYDISTNTSSNYISQDFERSISFEHCMRINKEITEMLLDYKKSTNRSQQFSFLTPSRFEIINGD